MNNENSPLYPDEHPIVHEVDNKEIPSFKYVSIAKQIILFFVGFVGFQAIGLLLSFIYGLYGAFLYESNSELLQLYMNSPGVNIAINSICYSVVFLILVIIINKDFITILKSFKNIKPLVAGIIGFITILAFNIIYSNLLALLGVEIHDNDNESTLNSVINVYPFISLFIFGIIGPICEEITYRVGLFSIVKRYNTIVAYIVMCTVFTLIHFNFAADNMSNELLNIPFYLSAAFIFAFLYDKYGFSSSTYAHVINNLWSVSATIITGMIS